MTTEHEMKIEGNSIHITASGPRPLQTKPKWEAGKCCHDDCTWTMVTPCGAGLHICWMHYIMLDLPL